MKKFFNKLWHNIKLFFGWLNRDSVLRDLLIWLLQIFIVVWLILLGYTLAGGEVNNTDYNVVSVDNLVLEDGRYLDLSFDLGSPFSNNYVFAFGDIMNFENIYANSSEDLSITFDNYMINNTGAIWSMFLDIEQNIYANDYSGSFGFINDSSITDFFNVNITNNFDALGGVNFTVWRSYNIGGYGQTQFNFDRNDSLNSVSFLSGTNINYFDLGFNLTIDLDTQEGYYSIFLNTYADNVLVDSEIFNNMRSYNKISVFTHTINEYASGYDNGYNSGYDNGYNSGFSDGQATDFGFTTLLSSVFVGLGSFLSINILPNISIGAIIAVPIVFGIIYFIIGRRKGD